MRTSPARARRLPVAIALTCLVVASGAAEATDLGDLAWIAGSWITDPGELRFEEHWTQPAENALLGMSRTLAGDRMVFFEYLRIEADGDALFYVAQPKGRPPTRFRLTSWDGSEAIFENPEHDSQARCDGSTDPFAGRSAPALGQHQDFPHG